MNYYKRHLGDYARDTGHLTALEHGIYNLLLDWYYVNEKPIPKEKAIRISKGNPTETEWVLSEFFTLCSEGWRHSRADREIVEYHVRAEVNRATGKLGGRPRKTQTVSEWKPNGNPNVTLATSHKPVTKNKEESKALVQTSAARFDEWYAHYPVKKGKEPARKTWSKDKLDTQADDLITHTKLMLAYDDDWRRGYAPMASTYLNQKRWQDEPKGPRQEGSQAPSKGMNAILKLQEMTGGLDHAGSGSGSSKTTLLAFRPPSGGRHDPGDGNGMG